MSCYYPYSRRGLRNTFSFRVECRQLYTQYSFFIFWRVGIPTASHLDSFPFPYPPHSHSPRVLLPTHVGSSVSGSGNGSHGSSESTRTMPTSRRDPRRKYGLYPVNARHRFLARSLRDQTIPPPKNDALAAAHTAIARKTSCAIVQAEPVLPDEHTLRMPFLVRTYRRPGCPRVFRCVTSIKGTGDYVPTGHTRSDRFASRTEAC